MPSVQEQRPSRQRREAVYIDYASLYPAIRDTTYDDMPPLVESDSDDESGGGDGSEQRRRDPSPDGAPVPPADGGSSDASDAEELDIDVQLRPLIEACDNFRYLMGILYHTSRAKGEVQTGLEDVHKAELMRRKYFALFGELSALMCDQHLFRGLDFTRTGFIEAMASLPCRVTVEEPWMAIATLYHASATLTEIRGYLLTANAHLNGCFDAPER